MRDIPRRGELAFKVVGTRPPPNDAGAPNTEVEVLFWLIPYAAGTIPPERNGSYPAGFIINLEYVPVDML